MDSGSMLLLGLLAVWMLVLFVGFPYLQSRRQRRLVQQLAHGDDVVVLNGVLGKVNRVEKGRVEVEIAPKVRVWCLPSAVARASQR